MGKANANNMTDILYPTITAPSLKDNRYNNLSWNPLGWSEGTKADSAIKYNVNDNFTLTSNTTYYGIYGTGVEITFTNTFLIQLFGEGSLVVAVSFGNIMKIMFLMLFLGILGWVYPVMTALKVHPIEAIQGVK